MSFVKCTDCGRLVKSSFAMHECKLKCGYRNDLHRLMCQPESFFKAKPADKSSWKTGDIFFMPTNPGKLWRVRRVKGRTVWYIANQYGHNPPRGVIRKSYKGQPASWIKITAKP